MVGYDYQVEFVYPPGTGLVRQLGLRRCKRDKGDNDTPLAPDCIACPHPSFHFSHSKASAWIRSSGGGKKCNCTEMSCLNPIYKRLETHCAALQTENIYTMLDQHCIHLMLTACCPIHTLNWEFGSHCIVILYCIVLYLYT